jgi:hypothetical protein
MSYIPLANITLGGSDSEVLFSSIPAIYKDLVLIIQSTATSGQDILFRFNADASNYSRVYAYGPGSGTNSGSDSTSGWGWTSTARSMSTLQVMDYSATDKHKTILSRTGEPSSYGTAMFAGRWASTAAVTSLSAIVSSGSFSSGSTFSLYGVA